MEEWMYGLKLLCNFLAYSLRYPTEQYFLDSESSSE